MRHSCVIDELFAVFEENLTSADVVSARALADISVAIARRRKEMNMTQKQFSDYLNVTQGMVSKWEGGDYNFSIKTLADIATKLELDLNVSLKKGKSYYDAIQENHISFIVSSGERRFKSGMSACMIEDKLKPIQYNSTIQPDKNIIWGIENEKQYCLMEV